MLVDEQKMVMLCIFVILQKMGQKRWLFLLALFACLLSFSCGRGNNANFYNDSVSVSFMGTSVFNSRFKTNF